MDDMDVETWMKLVSDYDPTLVPDYTDHDCNAIEQSKTTALASLEIALSPWYVGVSAL